MKILIAEDEISITRFLKKGLEEEDFEVEIAENGKQALTMALENTENYDLILLDWMMPGASGIEICRKIRQKNASIPILFLTARDTVEDVVFGLEAGANDYLKKPFAFEELLARIKVLLRSKEVPNLELIHGDLILNPESHTINKGGINIELTQKEFALLELLLLNKGKVCRRSYIIEKIWDIHFEKDTSVIDVFINALRKKIDKPGSPSIINTVRGIGYRINHEL